MLELKTQLLLILCERRDRSARAPFHADKLNEQQQSTCVLMNGTIRKMTVRTNEKKNNAMCQTYFILSVLIARSFVIRAFIYLMFTTQLMIMSTLARKWRSMQLIESIS